MSGKFIDIKQTTDIAELQETVQQQSAKIDALRGRIKYLEDQLKAANVTIQTQQSVLRDYETLAHMQNHTLSEYDRLMDEYSGGSGHSSPAPTGLGPSGSHLTHGFGMSYSADEGAKLYRVSDPDGPLIPELEFKQAELEIGRGQGIHFGIHWNKKK